MSKRGDRASLELLLAKRLRSFRKGADIDTEAAPLMAQEILDMGFTRASPWRPWSELDPDYDDHVVARVEVRYNGRLDHVYVDILRWHPAGYWQRGGMRLSDSDQPTHFWPIPPLEAAP